ncbi:serine acetyltransferase [Flavobacterium sp. IMCC34852]|uniref:Serine acetyltransferase n=1 Tax=Flavobacterium rivulicola TaxID=2732161 RepID=A0A7Y3VZI0_9FLAO|nr:serine acetyltransferase [Flavobacterium sp. IMCC34852]NNT72557.1 serine acetyltransferase [Flavobacterium sp. IMCC34852]
MWKIIQADCKRHGNKNFFLLFFTNPILRFSVLFRLNQKLSRFNPLLYFFRVWFKNLKQKYNLQIPIYTKIGKGFLLNHYGGIVINQHVVVGENCNVSQGVTLGNVSRGKLKGTPTIGDRVWIGANAVVVGNIKIGNDVLIAPLSYVNFDIPDNAVVAGNPAVIINYNTSAGYLKNLI